MATIEEMRRDWALDFPQWLLFLGCL